MKNKKFTKIIVTLAIGFALSLFAAACNHGDDDSSSATTTAATTATTARATTTTAAPAPVNTYQLTILHNNDGESKLLPDAGDLFPGIARFVAELETQQADAALNSDGVITLTSGDNFLASKELNISLSGSIFYDALALSGLYDAMALGNHDFDFGPDITERFINAFSPAIPFLSANADVSEEPGLVTLVEEGKLAKSVIITKDGREIGVIGAVTQSLPSISSPRRVVLSDVATAVQAEADDLTEAGVNIIILVSHLQGVDEEIALIGEFRNIDVVIAGGGDELVKNPSDSCFDEQNGAAKEAGEDLTPPYSDVYPIEEDDADGNTVFVVTGPGGYRCLGRLNIGFDDNGIATSWDGQSIGISVTGAVNDDIKTRVEDPLTVGLEALDTDIVGVSAVNLDGRRSQVRTTETNVGNLLADSFIWNSAQRASGFGVTAPQVAVTNGGGIRNDAIIDAGDVSVSDTFDIAPFSNDVVVMTISRQTFKDLMETTIVSAPDAGGGFAQVGGFRITYDLRQTARVIDRDNDCAVSNAGSRVRTITLDDGTTIVQNGQVVPGDDIVLTITDFLAGGGDCYPLGDIDFTRMGLTYQQSLANYIREGLSGMITATQYPTSGNGRITIQQ